MMPFWLAPLVVAERLPRIAHETSNLASGKLPNGRLESERMITEKMLAVQAGTIAAQVEAWRISLDWGTRLAFGDLTGLQRLTLSAPSRIMAAASEPAGQTVKANAARLARNRLRG
jgi:hypothetical protein